MRKFPITKSIASTSTAAAVAKATPLVQRLCELALSKYDESAQVVLSADEKRVQAVFDKWPVGDTYLPHLASLVDALTGFKPCITGKSTYETGTVLVYNANPCICIGASSGYSYFLYGGGSAYYTFQNNIDSTAGLRAATEAEAGAFCKDVILKWKGTTVLGYVSSLGGGLAKSLLSALELDDVL